MEIDYGKEQTQDGPGVSIKLTGHEVAMAIDAWLLAHGVHVRGPRTVTVNGDLCKTGEVFVDQTGRVNHGEQSWNGRGPEQA